ncbi:sialidase family protein [Actinopolymorpha sp. B11F2]|uniref:sialidase family protein n=1 Tax=Actinopolymorpha sp. B11F2 TaxID=3160862 RepID=UPI0032E408C2
MGALVGLAATPATGSASQPAPTAANDIGRCAASVPFVSGERGYEIYRIPAIIQAADGTLVAFAEARESRSDAGSIDIVRRRSDDGGCTWGTQAIVADEGDNTIGNPAPVVDPATGDLVLLSTRNAGSATEAEILRGEVPPEDSRRVFVQVSRDDGKTFSPLREITSTTKQPDWRWYATGPGHAIALTQGPHAGRLVVPANHSSAPPPGSTDTGAEPKYYGAHSLYSDDRGKTWRIGFSDDSFDGALNTNESTAAELPDGTIYFNTRDQNGTSPETRADGISRDGGESLVAPYAPQPDLVGPVVQGTVLQVRGMGWPLLFSGPSDPNSRARMAIRVSEDGGKNWEQRYLVSERRAAYSDMVQLPGQVVGLLYETGLNDTYETIRFERISLEEVVR